jgi:hypothetical protein
MGTCICYKKDEQFSMNDLNGMEKYYTLISKQKADILIWLANSEGPWKTPDSFLCFKQIDAQNKPVKMSNEDEIRIRALESKSSVNNDFKQTICTGELNPINSTLSIVTSTGRLLEWSSDW